MRSGLESLRFLAIRRNRPAIRFGRNARIINRNNAIRESHGIAGREKKVAGQKWAILAETASRDAVGMSRPRASLGLLPDDLYIEPEPWPRIGRPPKHDVEAWTVTDDWRDPVPITDAELDVFEAWFGDLFDELFGPCR